eukprot:15459349-Alexandrium_andersonii.AAC.1
MQGSTAHTEWSMGHDAGQELCTHADLAHGSASCRVTRTQDQRAGAFLVRLWTQESLDAHMEAYSASPAGVDAAETGQGSLHSVTQHRTSVEAMCACVLCRRPFASAWSA